LVILVDGKVVGSALSLIVDESLVDKNHITLILLEIYLSTHNQKGMSCTELIFYTPNYRGLRLAVDCMMLEKSCVNNPQSHCFAGRILITASTLLR
jgi:hypothetical protein